ncbi:hypothetical protein [Bacteroides clarus]|mgnify:CR=1 FL=1
MNKKEVFEMAEKYSGRTISQVDYMAGFQVACNIVREKLETSYNEEYLYLGILRNLNSNSKLIKLEPNAV